MCGYFWIGFIGFMLPGKTLTEFTNFFHQITLKKWWYNSELFLDKYLKMAECNSHETCYTYQNLHDQQQFMLSKINEIKDYFVGEIKERELMSKRLLLTILTIH